MLTLYNSPANRIGSYLFTGTARTSVIVLALAASLLIGSFEVAAMPHFHGSKPAIPKLNYDSLYAAAIPLDESPEGAALLDACLEAYGGVEKLSGISSGTFTWHMSSAMSEGDSIEVIRSWDNDDHYRIDKNKSGDWPESRWLCGEQAWYQTRDTVLELTGGGRYNAELFSYLVQRMPLAAKTVSFSGMRYGPRDPSDSLDYIYCLKQDTLLLVLGIDKESHFIRQVEGAIYQGGRSFVFVNYFDEHSPVSGIIVPHFLTNIAMGVIVGHSRLEEVRFNEDLSADFCRPRKYPATGSAH